ETVFDYVSGAPVVFDHLAREAIEERHKLILDYYEARRQQSAEGLKEAVPYKPVPPALMYLSPEDISTGVKDRTAVEFTPFATPEASSRRVLHAGSRGGRSFAEERADPNANVFDAAV